MTIIIFFCYIWLCCRREKKRTEYVYNRRTKKKTSQRLGPPPGGIELTKGAVHIAAQRGFVDYVLHNKTARDFFQWLKKTEIPDELFYASLNHNPHLGVPGAYKGYAYLRRWSFFPLLPLT